MASRTATRTRPPLVFVDADVWIDWLTRETVRHAETGEERWLSAVAVVNAILDRKVVLATDTLIEAEVNCNGKVKENDRMVRRKFSELMRNVSTVATEVDRFLVTDAVALSEVHGLRGPDAIHLAAAVRLKCDYLMSHDAKFPHGHTVHGVKVVRPTMVWQPDLFDSARRGTGA